MDFISNKKDQIKEMLQVVGVQSIEELFTDVPQSLICPPPKVDDGISEYEGMMEMEKLAAKNSFHHYHNYLGAGSYEHHVPAIISSICSKSEFLTSYTPYQPEASQGMLQAIFEFQSVICALTGMDVANGSVYDGASACAEACLMALRTQKTKNTILVAKSLHPHYQGVVAQYLESHHTKIISIPFTEDGKLDFEFIQKHIDNTCAALLVQSPNFFGLVEDLKPISKLAHAHNVLMLLCANPMAYGLYLSGKEQEVDICMGDTQPFGIPLQFGGPYAGYMACKKELMRQLPGRIAGKTLDAKGNKGFVLTLQAREQHIRREKATSNICTNQALAALASLIAMLWYGKEGVAKLALTNFQRAAYLQHQLRAIPGVIGLGTGPFFNEFAIKFPKPLSEVIPLYQKAHIEPGLNLGRFYPELENYLLIAVTETKNQTQLDQFVNVVRKIHE